VPFSREIVEEDWTSNPEPRGPCGFASLVPFLYSALDAARECGCIAA
jgi:hypothetical protein